MPDFIDKTLRRLQWKVAAVRCFSGKWIARRLFNHFDDWAYEPDHYLPASRFSTVTPVDDEYWIFVSLVHLHPQTTAVQNKMPKSSVPTIPMPGHGASYSRSCSNRSIARTTRSQRCMRSAS